MTWGVLGVAVWRTEASGAGVCAPGAFPDGGGVGSGILVERVRGSMLQEIAQMITQNPLSSESPVRPEFAS